MDLANLIILALFVEAIVQTMKPIWDKTAGKITIAEIVEAVDEPLDTTQCGGKENCQNDHICSTHHLWSNLNVRMMEYLDSVTLGAVVRGEIKRVISRRRPRKKASETGELTACAAC